MVGRWKRKLFNLQDLLSIKSDFFCGAGANTFQHDYDEIFLYILEMMKKKL